MDNLEHIIEYHSNGAIFRDFYAIRGPSEFQLNSYDENSNETRKPYFLYTTIYHGQFKLYNPDGILVENSFYVMGKPINLSKHNMDINNLSDDDKKLLIVTYYNL